MFCTSCGRRLEADTDAAYCTDCGTARPAPPPAGAVQTRTTATATVDPGVLRSATGGESVATTPPVKDPGISSATTYANYHQHLASAMSATQTRPTAAGAGSHDPAAAGYRLVPAAGHHLAALADTLWRVNEMPLAKVFGAVGMLAWLSGLLGLFPLTSFLPSLAGLLYAAAGCVIATMLRTRGTGRFVLACLVAVALLGLVPPRGILVLVPVLLTLVAAASAIEMFWGRPGETALMASPAECARPVWGEAGAHAAEGPFGTASRVGAEGERALGAALETLVTEFPHVRVFHGVRFTPGRDGADIDHVVLVGDAVYIVDAKNWAYDDYAWDRGTIRRSNASFENHMLAAVDKWTPLLADATPMARIVLTRPEPYRYRIDNTAAPDNICLATLDSLMGELRLVAAHSRPVVDRRLVRALATELQ